MKNIKVLIVEDELIIARNIELVLKHLEFETRITNNDIDTLECIKTFIPDVVLMDINLLGSVMDGIDLAKEILKHYDVPLIFITAYTDDEIIERAKRISPYGYIVKPIDNKNLIITIKIALYKHKYERIIREKESWFSKSLQSISDGFIATDLNGNIKFINKMALKFIDHKEEDVIGNSIDLIFNFKNIQEYSGKLILIEKYDPFFKKNPEIAKDIKIIISKENKVYLVKIKKEEIVDKNTKYGYVYLIEDMTNDISLAIELAIKNRQLQEMNISIGEKVKSQIKRLIEERNILKERNEFIENELSLARKIQIEILPKISSFPNINFLYHPVDKVGGDFFDFVKFREKEFIGIFLCDVSGHSLSAGFVTTFIKNLILESGKNKLCPSDLLYYLNNILLEKTAGHFITAFYGIYNLNTREFIYSNAGHNPPFIIREKEIIKLYQSESYTLPLAILNDDEHRKKGIVYKNNSIKTKDNEKIFLYTDGILDIKKVSDETIKTDENTILNLIAKYKNEIDHKIFLNSIFEELVKIRSDKNFEDDITMIVIS